MDDCGVILVVDHDRRFRLRTGLILKPLRQVVTTTADAESALQLAMARRPAVAIVEVELPGFNGLALLRQLVERFDGAVPVILVSAERTTPLDRAAGLLLGADDYLVKPVDPAELVARVGSMLRRSLHRSRNGAASGHARSALSPRERQILGLLAAGNTQRQIAESLVISPKTVGTHIQHVLSKLGVHSRAQAVAEAYRSHLVFAEPDHNLLAENPPRNGRPEAEALPPPAPVPSL